jgi:hypothetical protein
MQATVHFVDGVPGPQDNSWVDAVLSTVDHPAGALVARSLGIAPGVLVTFGGDTAGGPAGAVTVRPGTAYEVIRNQSGTGPGPARYLQLVTFAGRDPQWCAAFDRAGDERVWPAAKDVPGIVGAVIGSTSDGGRIALTLAASVEALEAAAAAIMSTTPLPWEQPEHLTGPDELTILRLLHADLPAGAVR